MGVSAAKNPTIITATLLRGRVLSEQALRIPSNVICPEEHAIIEIAQEINCTFPFHIKSWVVVIF